MAMPIVKAVGAAMIAKREGVEAEHPKAPTLQNLSLFPQRPEGKAAATRDSREQSGMCPLLSEV